MKKKAFTLAEMMIVLLILSIVLAAFAPIMTRRSKSTVSKDSPWLFASNNVDAYYSKGNGRAMIGQTSANQDDDARLILEKGDTLKNIMLFKQNGNALARLYIDSNNMYFGAVPASLNGTRNVGIGAGALANVNESTFWNTSKYD
ncbi:MAG: prepilin-type N-terminal cleavage/methylation domain-containing protein, partial [Heliobacteriaceae bacterium]|nr:prepilin-type N-terminal cleavage/methylation domain-containing protein [Heliobacteriaceae bacterium]